MSHDDGAEEDDEANDAPSSPHSLSLPHEAITSDPPVITRHKMRQCSPHNNPIRQSSPNVLCVKDSNYRNSQQKNSHLEGCSSSSSHFKGRLNVESLNTGCSSLLHEGARPPPVLTGPAVCGGTVVRPHREWPDNNDLRARRWPALSSPTKHRRLCLMRRTSGNALAPIAFGGVPRQLLVALLAGLLLALAPRPSIARELPRGLHYYAETDTSFTDAEPFDIDEGRSTPEVLTQPPAVIEEERLLRHRSRSGEQEISGLEQGSSRPVKGPSITGKEILARLSVEGPSPAGEEGVTGPSIAGVEELASSSSAENEIVDGRLPIDLAASPPPTQPPARAVYQVQGPDRYTALQGPLTVTIIKGLPSSPLPPPPPSPPEYLLLSVQLLHSFRVLGSRRVGPVLTGASLTTSLPCGVVAQGGTHVVRLTSADGLLAETVLLVRWPTVLLSPPGQGTPLTARFESKCRPVSSDVLLTCAELLYHGPSDAHRTSTAASRQQQFAASTAGAERRTRSLSQQSLLIQKRFDGLTVGAERRTRSLRRQSLLRQKQSDESAVRTERKRRTQRIQSLLDQKQLNSSTFGSESHLKLLRERSLLDEQFNASTLGLERMSRSLIISADDDEDDLFPDFYPSSLSALGHGGFPNSSNGSRLCVRPSSGGVLRPSTEGTVVERVGLPLLYSSGWGELKFDCRHLQDGRVYSARLTAQLPASPVLGTSPKFTISWSDVLSLDVSTRFMKECHGSVSVRAGQRLCVSSLNKVRVYARVPLNVDSVNPPVEEKYVAEYRVARSPVNIPCSLFTEGPSQYCFSYISVASSGAVTEVARTCRPTLRPGVAVRHGVWSDWSEWSECVPPCGPGQRIRYRYCDSPPPMNKGRYCQGNTTDVTPCDSPACDVIAPPPPTAGSPRGAGRLGNCSCGCLLSIALGGALRLQTNTSRCLHNATWLIESKASGGIEAVLSHASLLADRQWLKIRDGNSSTSPLLLTLPSRSGLGHVVFPLDGITHHLNTKNITKATISKDWGRIKQLESRAEPSWHVTSTDRWLRLEIHTFANSSSNITKGPMLGFTLLARASGAAWQEPLGEPVFSEIKEEGWSSYVNFVNFTAFFFIVAIISLILIIVGVYRLQYGVYRSSKMDNRSLCDSVGSSTDISVHHSPTRFSSLNTIAEVLSMASLPFNRRESSSNYTQLSDRNCVPLRNKSGYSSMPSSPFCGRASTASFMRKKKPAKRFEKNRRSASCDELESRFIFPIQEEIMTSSISETELSSSCKDDSGNESLKQSNKKSSRIGVVKKPQTNKGSFAYITKVKSLGGTILKNSTNDKNGQFPKSKTRLKLNLKRSATNENNQSPLPVARITSICTTHASSTSELSMAGADLEFDYYDYDMENASAVPGSLFGLDPTLMPWLPSILNIDEADDETEIYCVGKHPLVGSETTLTKDNDRDTMECIPMQPMGKKETHEETSDEIQVEDRTPVSCQSTDISASKAISLSNSDNSDEIPFADDSEDE